MVGAREGDDDVARTLDSGGEADPSLAEGGGGQDVPLVSEEVVAFSGFVRE